MTKTVYTLIIICVIAFCSCSGTEKIDVKENDTSNEVRLSELMIMNESNIIGLKMGDSLVDVEKLIGSNLAFGLENQERNLKKYFIEEEYQLLEVPCRIHLEFIDDKVNAISLVLDDRTEKKEKEERYKDLEMIVEKLKEYYSEPSDEVSSSFENEFGNFDTEIYRWLFDSGELKQSLQVNYTIRDGNSTSITVIWGITEERKKVVSMALGKDAT